MFSRKISSPALLIAILALQGTAQLSRSSVTPMPDFIRQVRQADANRYLANPNYKVRDSSAFEEMRQYILTTYRGVNVRSSFVVDGQTVDCIPIADQPSLRGNQIAGPPPNSIQLNTAATHKCEEGTIPMRRITLEQLSRFETLQQFLGKEPTRSGSPPQPRN